MKPNFILGSIALVIAISMPLMAEETVKMDIDERINVDFPDESRMVIFRNVADLYELNLVVPESLEDGRVSIKLRNVTWREIFELGLKGTGYTWFSKGNIVWIVAVGGADQELAFMRERLQNASDDNLRLRRALTFLLKPDSPELTEGKRKEVLDLLSDPTRPASDIFAVLYSRD